ncbi:UDP-N-acetylmuramoyl-tripeptide--D-alanyl-D-alanine ligase [Marinoscillum sp. MHG1-6]|uniref:UDP-N-acetylmuramoyl-tripeptide--D-alanyl-D- alanine ligase n=1 Tax=Marinoscillum sp. MHG1-6 TaxID=2959627 RepID=UPI002157C7A7|nr:UDP-N-acetylmuramoyl-tripeptide--D-alanyl-D-alanine ligase [Marinoscillum sp. MHG1-6]
MMDNFIEFLYSKFLQSDGVSIDTRTVEPGNLFFALKGPNFNGNKYAAQALEKGAAYAVVDEKEVAIDPRIILAPYSGMEALQQLAVFHRSRFKRRVLGITGSNGKTTTKELVSRVLDKKFIVHATRGNLNNHLGVPITVLHIHPQVEVAIIEMGANHVGEIADLCKIAQPHYGLITNIGEAHTETFGGIDGVLRGKSELFDYLRGTGGKPFINVLDHRLQNMAKRFEQPILFPGEDVKLLGATPFVEFEMNGTTVQTQLIGAYNFGNIASAVAVGREFGVSDDLIAQAIAEYRPENQRSQILQKGNTTIILDAYNANPSSMKAAIDNLKNMPGPKAVVLADMKEVENSAEKHGELGAYISQQEFDKVIFMGPEIKAAHETCKDSLWFESLEALKSALNNMSFNGETVLIKASRSMKLETIVDLIA